MTRPLRQVAEKIPATFLLALVALHSSHIASARPDLFSQVNAIRAQGCARHQGLDAGLRRDRLLDRAAEALASGQRLREAMMDAGYRATRSASLEVSGSDAAIVDALARQGCKDIADPAFRDAGIFERGDAVWLVLAAPLIPPAERDAEDINRRVLVLVNEARAKPRRCGWKRFKAAAPLVSSATLQRAARTHAQDMAERSSLSHTGRDGSSPAERAAQAGYRWRTVGENIASGQATPEQVVTEWVSSPRHCANLMDADFTEMGVAFAVSPRSAAGIYWSQVLAAPRPGS